MRLTIAVPDAQVVEAPALLRLVRMTPACDVKADEPGMSYVHGSCAQGSMGTDRLFTKLTPRAGRSLSVDRLRRGRTP